MYRVFFSVFVLILVALSGVLIYIYGFGGKPTTTSAVAVGGGGSFDRSNFITTPKTLALVDPGNHLNIPDAYKAFIAANYPTAITDDTSVTFAGGTFPEAALDELLLSLYNTYPDDRGTLFCNIGVYNNIGARVKCSSKKKEPRSCSEGYDALQVVHDKSIRFDPCI